MMDAKGSRCITDTVRQASKATFIESLREVMLREAYKGNASAELGVYEEYQIEWLYEFEKELKSLGYVTNICGGGVHLRARLSVEW